VFLWVQIVLEKLVCSSKYTVSALFLHGREVEQINNMERYNVDARPAADFRVQ